MVPFAKFFSLVFGIAGRRAWIPRGHPTAPSAAAGMLGVEYYNEVLESIGESVNVWRLRGERDRDYAFRIAVELADRLNKLEADLEKVLACDPSASLSRNSSPRGQPHD